MIVVAGRLAARFLLGNLKDFDPNKYDRVMARNARRRLPPKNFRMRCSDQPRRSIASVSMGRSLMSCMPRGSVGPPSKSLPSET